MDATHTDTPTTDSPTTDSPTATAVPSGHDWEAAGAAWGRRPRDWACLFEHYALDVTHAIFQRIGVERGVSVLDVACGAGLAVRLAGGLGAAASGIDAARPLIEIARERTPAADLRVGSMFQLPWADGSFDAVMSINGIWGDCGAALDETFRVLRPGGRVGISFWGDGHLDVRPCFKAFARNSPVSHVAGMRRTNDIARPGVAEAMLASAGFEVVERGGRVSTLEWPDADTAWRAMSSVGPAVPALDHVGDAVLRPQVMAELDRLRDPYGIYRFRNDHQFVIARKPD